MNFNIVLKVEITRRPEPNGNILKTNEWAEVWLFFEAVLLVFGGVCVVGVSFQLKLWKSHSLQAQLFHFKDKSTLFKSQPPLLLQQTLLCASGHRKSFENGKLMIITMTRAQNTAVQRSKKGSTAYLKGQCVCSFVSSRGLEIALSFQLLCDFSV